MFAEVSSNVLLCNLAIYCYDAHMQTNLDESVSALLKARKGDWAAISQQADVSYSWLSKFVNGHIPNPGYATLARLHKLLSVPELASTPASRAQAATETVAGVAHG